jgi:16S rRNA (guanine527-N7)-methyltransferase
VTPPGASPPEGPIAVESRPSAAAQVFGSALPVAERYVGLLAGPGVTRGLVGPREPSRLWTRHVLNSAALAGLVPPNADVVDLGSGAGLPGIPVRLARPDVRMTLLEPMARRVAFLDEVVKVLGLDVHVMRGRAEDLARASTDVIVARAVAPLNKLVAMALPLLRPGGLLLALKGEGAAMEITAAARVLKRWPLATVSLVTVPTGTEPATVVRVALGGGASTEEDRER